MQILTVVTGIAQDKDLNVGDFHGKDAVESCDEGVGIQVVI